MSAVRTFVWRHPLWWTVALTVLAWGYLLRSAFDPHAGHHGVSPVHGLAMAAAMMLPLVWRHAGLIAQRSLWRRRHRAIALFVAAYLAVWFVYGVLAATALRGRLLNAGVLLLLAAVWQLTPWKRFALAACHRTIPLAPLGWKADRDCLRYGLRVAGNCLLSCWALMLVCSANHQSLWVMAALTAFVVKERTEERPRHARFALALLTGAVVSVVVPAL